MKTEEILRREAEYRVIREALGTYHVDLVAARAAQAQDPAANTAGEAFSRPDPPTCSEPSSGCDPEVPAATSPV